MANEYLISASLYPEDMVEYQKKREAQRFEALRVRREEYPPDHLWNEWYGWPRDDNECLCVRCCREKRLRGGELQRLRDERPVWARVTFMDYQLDRALNLVAEFCYSVRAIQAPSRRKDDDERERVWVLVVELRERAIG